MKKTFSFVLISVRLVFTLCFGASAAYTAPMLSDALSIMQAILDGSTDRAYDVNNDSAVNLKDVLYGIKRSLWSEELPAKEKTQLFGTNPSADSYTYNYCPSVMQEKDGTLHVYYCTNKGDHSLWNMTYIDYIGYRKGTPNGDGSYTWSDETIVLSPSASGAWDDKHTCDPSVIKGSFTYGGTEYSYLMAYLGCTQGDINDIGLAVANSPAGPWTKVGTAPLIDYTATEFWGVGQPSLINQGGTDSGKVWMFYTRGDATETREIVCAYDFSNLDAPVLIAEAKLENAGVVRLDNGKTDFINNSDYAYDDDRKVLFSSGDSHPHPESAPNYISSHFRVTAFPFGGSDIKELTYGSSSKGKWRYLAEVGSDDTGFARNHNTGLVRDEYGHTSGNILTVFYTVAKEVSPTEKTYRIYSMNFVK